jgi:hypothetical protein
MWPLSAQDKVDDRMQPAARLLQTYATKRKTAFKLTVEHYNSWANVVSRNKTSRKLVGLSYTGKFSTSRTKRIEQHTPYSYVVSEFIAVY